MGAMPTSFPPAIRPRTDSASAPWPGCWRAGSWIRSDGRRPPPLWKKSSRYTMRAAASAAATKKPPGAKGSGPVTSPLPECIFSRPDLYCLPVKRYWLLTGFMLAFFLAAFGAMSALDVRFLEDPADWMAGRGGLPAASAGVGLLIADVFLPVPSSLVMIAHGALFGVVLGTGLSLLGSLGATLFGFAVRPRGAGLLPRLVPTTSRHKADAMLARLGALPVLI